MPGLPLFCNKGMFQIFCGGASVAGNSVIPIISILQSEHNVKLDNISKQWRLTEVAEFATIAISHYNQISPADSQGERTHD